MSSEAEAISRSVQEALSAATHARLCVGLVESGLLELVPFDGATIDELAAHGLEPLATRLLANALTAAGFLDLRGDRYFVPIAVRTAFLADDGYLADRVRLMQQRLAAWNRLAPMISGEDPGPGFYRNLHEGPQIGTYLTGVGRSNADVPDRLAELAGTLMEAPSKILDLGGGHCRHATALATRFPDAEIHVIDLPGVVEHVRGQVDHRIVLRAGDARTAELEGGYDLIVLNDLLHYFDDDAERDILQRCVEALSPQGVLIVTKFTLDEHGSSPPQSAVLALQWLLSTGEGFLETDARTIELLRESGCGQVASVQLTERKTAIMGAHSAG